MVYLIHFHTPYTGHGPKGSKTVQHYIGCTDDLAQRLAEHKAGRGARLMEVVTLAGITWECVRTWEGSWALERTLKAHKKARDFCPICLALSAIDTLELEEQ